MKISPDQNFKYKYTFVITTIELKGLQGNKSINFRGIQGLALLILNNKISFF